MEFVTILSQIRKELAASATRPTPAVMYHIDAEKAFASVVFPDETTFRVYPDGQTEMQIAGMYVPVQGCPYPEAIFRLNFGVFAYRYRRFLPLAVLSIFGIAALQFLLSTIPGAPGAAWFLDYFAAAMNFTLVSLFGMCIVAFALRNFGRGITIRLEKEDPAALLTSGMPDITPDVLIMSASEEETPAEFAERIRQAHNALWPRGQYMVVFTFRSPCALIVRFPETGSQEVFHRANLTKDIPGWMQEVSDTFRFEHETWPQFVAYVNAFCIQYSVWAQSDKLKQGNPLKDMLHGFEAASRRVAVAIALLLCSVSAFADPVGNGGAVPVPKRFGSGFMNEGISSTMPDSVSFERMKEAYMVARAHEWQKLEPVVEFYMWRFEISWLIIFLGIGGILWIFAKVAARDSIKDVYGTPLFGDILTRMHIWSKGTLFVILAIISAVYLSEAIVRYYYTGGMPDFWTIAKWAGVCWLWYRVFEFIIPDTPGSKKPIMGQNSFPVANNNQRIG